MTDIVHQLSISTSTVIRKLNDFHFKHDFSHLPKIMSWDEYAFSKGKMSFISQDFEKLNIITVLEGRTQTIIRSTIEPFVVRWKSLLWICWVPTMTWLNSFFRVLKSFLIDFTLCKPCYESCACPNYESFGLKASWIQGYQALLETHPKRKDEMCPF